MSEAVTDWTSVAPDAAAAPEDCTVFARNLGYNLTDDQLEKMFEEIGPVKRAFVVTEKQSKRSKGFGFVTFATRPDAERAVATLNGKEIDKRKLKLEMAGKTNTHKQAKAAKTAAVTNAAGSAAAAAAKTEEDKEKAREARRTKNIKRVIDTRGGHRMLVITGLSKELTKTQLSAVLKPFGMVEALIYPAPDAETLGDRTHAAARVQFSTKAETGACALKLKTVGTQPVKVLLLDVKAARVIVRNLSFKTTEESLKAAADKFGSVINTHIPMKDGKARGFGFIQFDSLAAAGAAINQLGTAKLNGRTVAADWALAKDSYVSALQSAAAAEAAVADKSTPAAAAKKPAAAAAKPDSKSKSQMRDDDDDEDGPALLAASSDEALGVVDMMDDDDGGAAAAAAAKKKAAKPERKSIKIAEATSDDDAADSKDADMDAGDEDEDGGDGEGEDEDEDGRSELPSDADASSGDEKDGDDDDAEGEDSDGEGEDKDIDEGEDDDGDDDGDDGDDDDEAEHSKESDAVTEEKIQTAIDRKKSSDVGKGTTLFVRNLLFETTEEELLEKFKQYGPVKFAKIVMDRGKGYSRGTGFVQFYKLEDTEKVLAMCEASADSFSAGNQASKFGKARVSSTFSSGAGGIELGGRTLLVSKAVDRDQATKLKEAGDLKKEDRRNLYLAREGLILSNTESAAGVSPSDLEKRNAAYKDKKQKLKNPNFFISQTRLSIRNLPLELKDSALKKICIEALKKAVPTGGKPTLKQVKIIRSTDRFDANGVARSKRYGFVELTVHAHALALLRALNNNPTIFNADHRPIVEFALEDHRKLLVRKKRDEKIQQKKQQKAQLQELIADDPRAAAGSGTGITTVGPTIPLTPKQLKEKERQLRKRAARTERKIAREAAEAAAANGTAPPPAAAADADGDSDAKSNAAAPALTKAQKKAAKKLKQQTRKSTDAAAAAAVSTPRPAPTTAAAAAKPESNAKPKPNPKLVRPPAPAPAAAAPASTATAAAAAAAPTPKKSDSKKQSKPAAAAATAAIATTPAPATVRTPQKPAPAAAAAAPPAATAATAAATPKQKKKSDAAATPKPAAAAATAAPASAAATAADSKDGAAPKAVSKKDKSKCYNCKQSGHRAKDCPNPKISSGESKALIVAAAKAKTAAAVAAGKIPAPVPPAPKQPKAAAAADKKTAKPAAAPKPKPAAAANGAAAAAVPAGTIAEKPAPFNPKLKCFQCKKIGHRAKDCPHPKPEKKTAAGAAAGGGGSNKRKANDPAAATAVAATGAATAAASKSTKGGDDASEVVARPTKLRKKNERQERDDFDSMIDAYKAKLTPAAVREADNWLDD